MFAARLFPLSLLMAFSAGAPLSAGQAFLREATEANVNQRYTIESVTVGGIPVDKAKLPSSLRRRLGDLVGARCDMNTIGEVASALRREMHLRAVNEHLSKGSEPDRIRVNFEVVKREVAFEISVPKFLYHSRQGWSGEIDASAHAGPNTFTVGAVSNGDDLTERFNGAVARYQNSHVFSDKIRFSLAFENYQEQWTDSTRSAILKEGQDLGLDLYKSRRNIAPELTFAPVKNFTVSAGMSFEQMQSENNLSGSRAANAATGEFRYARTFEGETQQQIDARYNVRIGIHAAGSDYGYARHSISLRYELKSGHQIAFDELTAGTISGDAPFFERFVLGSSSTLRGWDRYSINPLGGNRAIHNSLSYGYQFGDKTAEVFYDSGALWNRGNNTGGVRHSLGIGYRQGIFVLTMAVPVVDGHVVPVFMAGMNY